VSAPRRCLEQFILGVNLDLLIDYIRHPINSPKAGYKNSPLDKESKKPLQTASTYELKKVKIV
jgi:hypothetical protein